MLLLETSFLIEFERSKITLREDRVQQSNLNFPLLGMSQMPEIKVALLESGDKPGGMDETGVPLVAPAIANAVFSPTGTRVRSLPLSDSKIEFV